MTTSHPARAWTIKLVTRTGQRLRLPVIAPDWASAARRAIEIHGALPVGIVCLPVRAPSMPEAA